MVDSCVTKDSSSCDTQQYHPRLQVKGDATGVITRGVCAHAPVIRFMHGFIKFMYINKILMKTRL